MTGQINRRGFLSALAVTPVAAASAMSNESQFQQATTGSLEGPNVVEPWAQPDAIEWLCKDSVTNDGFDVWRFVHFGNRFCEWMFPADVQRIEYQELNQLLADGKLVKTQLARIVTLRYTFDIYDAPMPKDDLPEVSSDVSQVRAVSIPFATMPINVWLDGKEPLHVRMAKAFRAGYADIFREIRAKYTQASKVAQESLTATCVPCRMFSYRVTPPRIWADRRAYIADFFFYAHVISEPSPSLSGVTS